MVCPITNANMHIYIIIPLILNTNVYISKPYHIIHVHVCPTKPKRRTLTYHAAALQVHLDLALERPPRGAHWELLPGVYPALSVLRVGVQFTCKTIGHNGQTPIPRSDPCSAAAGTPVTGRTLSRCGPCSPFRWERRYDVTTPKIVLRCLLTLRFPDPRGAAGFPDYDKQIKRAAI